MVPAAHDTLFAGSIPELYDELLVPLIFEPYAEDLARRVAALRPQDQTQIIDFDSRVSVVAPFTATRADLEKAINSTVAGGSTSLYNAIYIALRELNKVKSRTVEDLRRRIGLHRVVDAGQRQRVANRAEIGFHAVDVEHQARRGRLMVGKESGDLGVHRTVPL